MKRKPLYALFYMALLLALSCAAMFLWNTILPESTHLSKINYWQALGLLLLCRILFGRFHFSLLGNKPGDDDQQHLLKEKLMTMSEEDRALFKEEWRKRSEDKGKQ